jgi:hypothetical protein
VRVSQLIGYTLINCSAITSIVGASTQSRITHGTRPQSSALSSLPCINYYEMPGNRKNGIAAETFSINCRAATSDAAMNLANLVIDLFHGSSGTGTYGTNNSFDVARASLKNHNGLIPEPSADTYNVPVDILITYAVDTVS